MASLFPGIIRIDLTQQGEVMYPVSQANRLWLAKFVAIGGKVASNPLGANAQIGVRIQDQSNDQMPFAILDGFMNTYSGKFDRLWVTVLYVAGGATQLFLNTGNGVSAGYCNNDGLSPTVGGGAGGGSQGAIL